LPAGTISFIGWAALLPNVLLHERQQHAVSSTQEQHQSPAPASPPPPRRLSIASRRILCLARGAAALWNTAQPAAGREEQFKDNEFNNYY
jgi:hypothetical protein